MVVFVPLVAEVFLLEVVDRYNIRPHRYDSTLQVDADAEVINLTAGEVVEQLQVSAIYTRRAELWYNNREQTVLTMILKVRRIQHGHKVTRVIRHTRSHGIKDQYVLGRMTLQQVVDEIHRVTRAIAEGINTDRLLRIKDNTVSHDQMQSSDTVTTRDERRYGIHIVAALPNRIILRRPEIEWRRYTVLNLHIDRRINLYEHRGYTVATRTRRYQRIVVRT